MKAGLTAWAALWTIFIWPLWSCTFRKTRFRNRSSIQLNSLESDSQSEMCQGPTAPQEAVRHSSKASTVNCPHFMEEGNEP